MQYANPMQLTARDPKSGLVRVVIDTPAASRNKYKFDAELGVFKLSRVLPAGMSFPFDFGSVPGTRAEDGDALDVLVISEAPLFVGCLVHVRLIGVIRARQTERGVTIRNDRLVGSLETPVNKAAFRELSELSRQTVREIEHFFHSYNEAQGRKFRITGRGGAKAAERLLIGALQSAAPA
jgi:inorganic pyrophosphatase